MYWKTQDGDLLEIKSMDTSHLLNCKFLLERKDIKINTLSLDASAYSNTRYKQISYKDDWQHVFINSGNIQNNILKEKFDYSKSPEYLEISKELKNRGF